MIQEIAPQGLVEVQVVHNIRNMGHCRIVNGQSFCSEIYRSATLGGLTEAGVLQLGALGITTIVDLRSSSEVEIRPTRDVSAANIRTIHAPVVEYDGSPTSPEDFKGYAHRYRELLVLGMNSYRLLFETVAENDGGVLFHCAAGKDRTGVAAALLLLFAGVADEEIIEDYSRSAGLLEPLFEQWRPRFEDDGVSEDAARRLMGSHPEDMSATLDHIRQEWGGAEGYMSAIGMSPEALTRLRSRLTGA